MSNDLISRSALLKCLSINDDGRRIPEYDCDNFAVTIPIKEFKDMVRKQPTAYDVDKIVEELKSRIDYYYDAMKDMARDYPRITFNREYMERMHNKAVALTEALNVVNGGGIR